MDAISERRYPGHQRDIGHTLQLTLSSLVRLQVDPNTGAQCFADPEELNLAGGLLGELHLAVAFCAMAEKERWNDQLPANLKVLCHELAMLLASLGAVDPIPPPPAKQESDDDDEPGDDEQLPERPSTLSEIGVLVDVELRAWASALSVSLPQLP